MRSVALIAAVVAVAAALGLLALPLLVASPEPTPAERVEALAAQLRCPDCQSLSVAESRTAAAAAIRAEIEQQVAAGRSDDGVRAYFTERYGEWILLAPPDPLVWWPPAVAVVTGVLALAAWYWSRRRTPGIAAPPPPDDAQRERIREELEALDG